jgi:hypothetical protein
MLPVTRGSTGVTVFGGRLQQHTFPKTYRRCLRRSIGFQPAPRAMSAPRPYLAPMMAAAPEQRSLTSGLMHFSDLIPGASRSSQPATAARNLLGSG